MTLVSSEIDLWMIWLARETGVVQTLQSRNKSLVDLDDGRVLLHQLRHQRPPRLVHCSESSPSVAALAAWGELRLCAGPLPRFPRLGRHHAVGAELDPSLPLSFGRKCPHLPWATGLASSSICGGLDPRLCRDA